MAIRKISELPYVDCTKTENKEKVSSSKIEISYPNELTAPYMFQSKHIRVDKLGDYINFTIIGDASDTSPLDMYRQYIFKSHISAKSGFELTGELNVNGSTSINAGTGGSFQLTCNSIKVAKGSTDVLTLDGNGFSFNNNVKIGEDVTIDGSATVAQDATFEKNVNLTGTNSSLNVAGNASFGKDVNLTGTNSSLNVAGNASFGKDVNLTGTNSILNVEGNANFRKVINGIALRAKWADLAEMYESDREYVPGTMIKFGGEKEITIANDEAHGIITSKPGLILNGNSDDEGKIMIGVALTGRVPILVNGVVKKGDKIVLSDDTPGVGQVKSDGLSKPILAIALSDKPTSEVGLVECVTKINF